MSLDGRRGIRSVRTLCVLALAVACLLSACAGGSKAAGQATVTPFATYALAPTPTYAPTSTPVADPLAVCTSAPGARVSIGSAHVGAFDGGWQALPSNLVLKPQPGSLSIDGQLHATLALKGVTLWLDLKSSANGATGNVCAVTVKIVGYQPLPAPIPNVTKTCLDAVWQNPGGVSTADCGAVGAISGQAGVVFTSTATETAQSSAFHDVNNPQSTQPIQAPATGGQAINVWAHVDVPASGTYTFSVGIWQDRSGPVVFTTMRATFDVDAQHEWSGRACSDPAMQAQLPAPTDPPSSYICPGGPPTQE